MNVEKKPNKSDERKFKFKYNQRRLLIKASLNKWLQRQNHSTQEYLNTLNWLIY